MVIVAMAIVFVFLISHFVFEYIPHFEDEVAYQWQARVFAAGEISVPSPKNAEATFIPFVLDYNGRRFGKYPPGWPVFLAIGMLFNIEHWVPAILAGLNAWFTFRISQRIFGKRGAILTLLFLSTSPFFLFNSGSLLSHGWSLFLTLSFTLVWLDLFTSSSLGNNPRFDKVRSITAGLSIGVLFITRPLTALGVAFPFLVHSIILLRLAAKTPKGIGYLIKMLFIVGFCAVFVGCFLFLWQYATTGDPLQNLYELWWKFDKVGFGPGYGRNPGGHTLFKAFAHIIASLRILNIDLFGWRIVSLLFIPFGVWSLKDNLAALLTCSIPFSLMTIHMAYWFAPITFFGPRYYFEGIFGLCILTSAGVFWLASLFSNTKISRWLTGLTLTGLTLYNLFIYMPLRVRGMMNLYGINQASLQPFLMPNKEIATPALIVVDAQRNTDYFGLLTLEDPWLTTPFIFAYGKPDIIVDRSAYSGRVIYKYIPETQEFIKLHSEE